MGQYKTKINQKMKIMCYLTLYQNNVVVNRFEVNGLRQAKEYIQKEPDGTIGVFSTINQLGIENTLRITRK